MTDNCHGHCQQVISGCCDNSCCGLSTGYLRVLRQQQPMTNNCHRGCQQVISGVVTTAAVGCQQVISGVVTTAAVGCQQVISGVVTTAAVGCQQVISGCCNNNNQRQTTATGAVNRLSQGVATTTTNDRQLPQGLSTGYLRCCGSSCHAGLPDCVSVGAIEQTSKGVGGAQRYHSHRNLVKILSTNILHMHEKCLGWLQ